MKKVLVMVVLAALLSAPTAEARSNVRVGVGIGMGIGAIGMGMGVPYYRTHYRPYPYMPVYVAPSYVAAPVIVQAPPPVVVQVPVQYGYQPYNYPPTYYVPAY